MFGAIAWGALGGTQLDHESTKSVPMQRGARSVFCRSVPMQRGARFLIFGDRSMVQHGVDEGVKNIYKTNVILHIFNLSARRERPPSGSQRAKFAKRHLKMNKLLVRSSGVKLHRSSKRYEYNTFGAPEAPNIINIILLELQKLQTL